MGLWQIRTYKHPEYHGTDGQHRKIEVLREPLEQAKSAVWIAQNHHLRLNAWTVYREQRPAFLQNVGNDQPFRYGHANANRWNLDGAPR